MDWNTDEFHTLRINMREVAEYIIYIQYISAENHMWKILKKYHGKIDYNCVEMDFLLNLNCEIKHFPDEKS